MLLVQRQLKRKQKFTWIYIPGWGGRSMNRVIQTKNGYDQTIQPKICPWFEFERFRESYCEVFRKNAFMFRKFATIIRKCDYSKLCNYDQTKISPIRAKLPGWSVIAPSCEKCDNDLNLEKKVFQRQRLG